MKSNLAEIVLQNIEFFGLAPDSDIHPDAAVRQLEIVSTLLKELPQSELEDFFTHVQRRLERLGKEGAPQEQLDFLRNIREHLGRDL
jgi:hypothetical protein